MGAWHSAVYGTANPSLDGSFKPSKSSGRQPTTLPTINLTTPKIRVGTGTGGRGPLAGASRTPSPSPPPASPAESHRPARESPSSHSRPSSRLDAVKEPAYVRNRRASVSAEPMAPDTGPVEKIVHAKSDEARARINSAVSKNLLFRNMDEEQKQEVYDAMFEKKVEKGETIIKQGDGGDFFYVIDQGAFDIFVAKDGQPPVKVVTVGPGGSFGELALMYNAPRAATCVATCPSVVWALDRVTFRRMIMNKTFTKRRLYEKFLREVPVLADLSDAEISRVADALEPVVYKDGEVIIRQADAGDSFYIVAEGAASVRQQKEGQPELELCRLHKGNYFGEIALLTDRPRAATVVAHGDCQVVCIDRPSFTRLFGPVQDILRRNISNYKTYEYILAYGQ